MNKIVSESGLLSKTHPGTGSSKKSKGSKSSKSQKSDKSSKKSGKSQKADKNVQETEKTKEFIVSELIFISLFFFHKVPLFMKYFCLIFSPSVFIPKG